MKCEYRNICRFYSTRDYESCHYRIDLCQLHETLQENVRLKKQIADGGLEEKAKEDDRLRDEKLLGQIELN